MLRVINNIFIYTNCSLSPTTGQSIFGTLDPPNPGSVVSELLGAKVRFPGFDTNSLVRDQMLDVSGNPS